MQTDKILSMMGLCRRAGKLAGGFDLVCEKIREGKAYLTLAAEDISEKTFKNLNYEAQKYSVPAIRIEADMTTMGKACGIKAGVAVVTDEGFAKALLKLIRESTEGGV
ncbi:L7Ae/L30e/S12e/Gadd45 family ribosomal protein [Scatolibacter rhodanostii]|uniref:L7Ae/L30e/S12e/Gadd45 family ribosomal protein n=1 Tax=Scatolibacter rhodanostii TaxID=2014781 RepID=UPI001356314F|nr:ribosomal L7Ae/L30e/S12e/Gadd45 family protein [Scatolibacter rhodanostii]